MGMSFSSFLRNVSILPVLFFPVVQWASRGSAEGKDRLRASIFLPGASLSETIFPATPMTPFCRSKPFHGRFGNHGLGIGKNSYPGTL
ncbi:hypothetical protein NPIL_9051 [Nephila pilipes]|uniref:Secreted protein n=1 Tax=Nephila pilipes TaxID=299642 RepID=A0A8X6NDV5_NEPPI|nr:hypothetical protein NPIL_9051 [Nephila pilipes]